MGWDEMKSKRIQPNVITYSTAMNAFKEDHQRVRELWDEMKSQQIQPDVITYSTAINAFKDDHQRVHELWDEMRFIGIERDIFTCTMLVDILDDDVSGLNILFKEMKTSSTLIDGVFKRVLLLTFTKKGDVQAAFEVLDDMKNPSEEDISLVEKSFQTNSIPMDEFHKFKSLRQRRETRTLALKEIFFGHSCIGFRFGNKKHGTYWDS